MGKTKIPWCDFSLNPVKGLCPVDCRDLEGRSYCYATRLYDRFRWNPEIRYDDLVWHKGKHIPPGSRVFVGSMIEQFGPWVPEDWNRITLEYCEACPSTTFIFLTKRPWELQKYNPWPRNCWVGTSIDKADTAGKRVTAMWRVNARVRFLSIEPMLEKINLGLSPAWINWLILGGMTGCKKWYPPEKWIADIDRLADMSSIPIFEKPNLRPKGPYRQEWPKV